MNDDLDYIPEVKASEETRKKVIAMVEMISFCSGCKYGLTIENDGTKWRVVNWSSDTANYVATGYGDSLEEAVNACWSYEVDGTFEQVEEMDREWDDRRGRFLRK